MIGASVLKQKPNVPGSMLDSPFTALYSGLRAWNWMPLG
jgi:hypothetical protein